MVRWTFSFLLLYKWKKPQIEGWSVPVLNIKKIYKMLFIGKLYYWRKPLQWGWFDMLSCMCWYTKMKAIICLLVVWCHEWRFPLSSLMSPPFRYWECWSCRIVYHQPNNISVYGAIFMSIPRYLYLGILFRWLNMFYERAILRRVVHGVSKKQPLVPLLVVLKVVFFFRNPVHCPIHLFYS